VTPTYRQSAGRSPPRWRRPISRRGPHRPAHWRHQSPCYGGLGSARMSSSLHPAALARLRWASAARSRSSPPLVSPTALARPVARKPGPGPHQLVAAPLAARDGTLERSTGVGPSSSKTRSEESGRSDRTLGRTPYPWESMPRMVLLVIGQRGLALAHVCASSSADSPWLLAAQSPTTTRRPFSLVRSSLSTATRRD